LCAAGADGVYRALEVLRDQAMNELGQLGVPSLDALDRSVMRRMHTPPIPQV
jgi:(S)-mandelate dehydrogenase